MNKYLISDNHMCRYFCDMNYKRLSNSKLMFLDYVYEGDDEKIVIYNDPLSLSSQLNYSKPRQLGLKLYDKIMKPEDFKNINIRDIDKLYDDLINFYYDNSFNSKENAVSDEDFEREKIIREINLNDPENDYSPTLDRRIVNYIGITSNLIAQKGRIGPGNLCILPEKIYNRIGNMVYSGLKTIKNPTGLHQDKIFVVKLSEDMSQGGVSVLTDYPLSESRELKLLKIMDRIKKITTVDKFMNYSIVGTGLNFKYQVGVIYLKE